MVINQIGIDEYIEYIYSADMLWCRWSKQCGGHSLLSQDWL